MKIKNPKTEEEIYIYSARLKFRKEKNENGQVKNMVQVVIRYGEKGPARKKDVQIPDEPNPDDPYDLYIDTDKLEWTKYQGKPIAVYHRIGEGVFEDSRRIRAHTILCSGLENIIYKACFGNSNKTKHKK